MKEHAKKCCRGGGHAPLRCHCECTCDGYHTFDELYEHRITLFIALCEQITYQPYCNDEKFGVWKSKRHSDGEICFGTGTQFVLGIGMEKGNQITYHIPIERWNETDFAEVLEKAPEYDGHTSDDVLERLKTSSLVFLICLYGFSKMINNQMAASRAEVLKNSPQLMLGELILKLEAVKNKELPVVFDDGQYHPTGLCSWRGSYCELAIQYQDGGSSCYEQMQATCQKDEFGDHHYECSCGGSKEFDTTLPEKPTANDFLRILKLIIGKYFVGYKGGDFTMGKNTPLWVANYGRSSGFKQIEGKSDQGVVDVEEQENQVIIKTEATDF